MTHLIRNFPFAVRVLSSSPRRIEESPYIDVDIAAADGANPSALAPLNQVWGGGKVSDVV